MAISDILTAIFASLGGALSGAFFGAWFQNRYQLKGRQRQVHLDDIKQKCLVALKESLNKFWQEALWIRELAPIYEQTVADPAVVQRLASSYRDSSTLLMFRAAPSMPDRLLYEDLKNHYDFKDDLDNLDKGLDGKFGAYQISKLELFSRIYQFLNDNVVALDLSANLNQTKLYAEALFFERIQKSPAEWPNVFSNSIGVRALFETWPRKGELIALGSQFLSLHADLESKTQEMTAKVERALNSQKSLQGSCEYLD